MTKTSITFRLHGNFVAHGTYEGDWLMEGPVWVTLTQKPNPKAVKGFSRRFRVGSTHLVFPDDVVKIEGMSFITLRKSA